MNTFKAYSGARPWYLAVLVSALAAGCGGGGTDPAAVAASPMAVTLHSSSSGSNGSGNSSGNGAQSEGNSNNGNGNHSGDGNGNGNDGHSNDSHAKSDHHEGGSEDGNGDGSGGGPVIVPGTQSPVNLGAASTFAILSETGVTDVYASVINGDVGASPITGAAIGLTCPEVVTGIIYSVDAAGPVPCVVTNATLLTSAVGAMETAYTDAAGRTSPGFTELGAGEIGGLTLAPGLYKWGTGVLISSDVTLAGGPNDVWIFQIAGTLTQASAVNVTLTGGALAKNIIWQVAGAVAIGTTAHFEGVLLAKTLIAVNTGATVNGRLLAQTAVTLQQNAVTQPAP
jgi:hypothetical protein